MYGAEFTSGGQKKITWLCQCDCGAQIVMRGAALRSGNTQSCGCLRRDVSAERARIRNHRHGACDSPTYNSWVSMRKRCLSPSTTGYKYWGGRGITICDRWLNSFDAFLEDVGERPEGMTLERIDNDGNYEPGNVRWATRAEQNRNKRRRATV